MALKLRQIEAFRSVMREGSIAAVFAGDQMTPENLVRAAVGIGETA